MPGIYDRVRNFSIRKGARLFFRRNFKIRTDTPLVSFTFDDFPRSALYTVGAILKAYGLTGTYYAGFGLMGTQIETGEMFLPEDLKVLFEQGHELGCHTFDHYDSSTTNPRVFEGSIIKNRLALGEAFPNASFKTFSYPINQPRPLTKQRAARHFVCCRGGGQTFNAGTTDLNHLNAYFIEKSRDDLDAIRDVIERNRRARGWLILATHDICNEPSLWGCTPEVFDKVVQYAVNSGSRILPVAQAWEALCASGSS